MSIDTTCVNAIRALSADAVQKANSGHPGLPLGSAAMAYELWAHHMTHNPKNSKWANRDRFVLSGGHGSAMLYSLLHLFGYGLTIDDLKNFRQDESKTPGHPEYGWTNGVEATTGPLGAGMAMAVGMAMAEAHLAATFNKPDFNIYFCTRRRRLLNGRYFVRSFFVGGNSRLVKIDRALRQQQNFYRRFNRHCIYRKCSSAYGGFRFPDVDG